ncbi:MAG: hypothetical protein RLZZ124_391 [Cyanobacteriota bacterium]|jgi:hypothetical protein
MLLALPGSVAAAEVLQVRSGRLLLVGDHNRSYSVELACLQLPADGDAAAAAWLREALPRRTRVNLRPIGNHDGLLLARVSALQGSASGTGDLSEGLIQAGLATAPAACPA